MIIYPSFPSSIYFYNQKIIKLLFNQLGLHSYYNILCRALQRLKNKLIKTQMYTIRYVNLILHTNCLTKTNDFIYINNVENY